MSLRASPFPDARREAGVLYLLDNPGLTKHVRETSKVIWPCLVFVPC